MLASTVIYGMYQLEIRHDNCCRSNSICTLKIHLPLQNVRYQVSDQNLSPDFPYQRSSLVTPGGIKYHHDIYIYYYDIISCLFQGKFQNNGLLRDLFSST